MTDGTTKQWTAFAAMAEVAATMMKAAFSLPIAAMRTALNLQDKAIGFMETVIPGAAPETWQTSGSVQWPPPTAGVSTAQASPTTGAATGWGPVTPQTQVTGWGPMPRS